MHSIELAQALIRCPSVTPEDAGVLGVLQQFLEPLGFVCERLRFEAPNTPPVENLYARYGTAAPHLCFAGHTDVVPVGDEAAWRFPPFGATIHEGMLYGRGAEDMKGAVAAFAVAVAQAIAAGEVKGSLSFLITNDEEGPAINGTRKVLELLDARGERWDGCIVGEPTNPTTLGEMAKIGRRGSFSATLTVEGTQGHVAYPHLAENPITPLVRILTALKATPLDGGTDFFPPSNLEVTSVDVGNSASNVIPARARAVMNIRFNDLQTPEKLEAWLRHHCDAQHCRYQLTTHCSAEAFLTPPGALSALVSEAITHVTGLTPALTTTGGTSDARFIKDYCPVVEFGTTGGMAHKVDECVKVEDLESLTQVYRRVIARFMQHAA